MLCLLHDPGVDSVNIDDSHTVYLTFESPGIFPNRAYKVVIAEAQAAHGKGRVKMCFFMVIMSWMCHVVYPTGGRQLPNNITVVLEK
jgi:hypothetical protein